MTDAGGTQLPGGSDNAEAHATCAMQPSSANDQLVASERAKWQTFYQDRSRPCPFFVLAPDENLSEWVQQGVLQPGRALDIGCGNARNSIYLASRGFTVDAVDLSASAVRWAQDEIDRAGASVSVRCVSIFDFELDAGSYDVVYDAGCFHHIEPRRRSEYVQRVASALKPGGALGLVCFTPEGGSGYSDEDVYQRNSLGGGLGYDEPRLREIWGDAFDIQSVRRMREQPKGASLFGRDFLWTLLARRR